MAAAAPPSAEPDADTQPAPEASPFAGLPSPDDLPAPAPALDEEDVDEGDEPRPASSPPDDDAADDAADDDGDGDGDDDDDASASDASEPEPEPAKLQVKTLKKAKWIKHVIVPGERLEDIAARYQVRTASVIRWNKLSADKPKLYAGRELAVYTKFIPPPQQKIIYTVQFGDTWPKIAKRYHVDEDKLRKRWNTKVPRKFKAGQEIVIWLDPLDDPSLVRDPVDSRAKASAGTSATAPSSASAVNPKLPLVKIKTGSVSVGKPNGGKIISSIALPPNAKLYTIRKPDESYGSSHTLHNLQLAIANWRQATGYSGELVIGAISKQGGGKLRPHSSHRSGRDVDIRLPLQRQGGSSDNVDDVDWDATWGLISALVATGEVQYIFLTTDRQKRLHKAAKRAGASKDVLERVIQYPNKSGTNNGIVRHAAGHTAHIHVRFTCAANETRCESY